MLTIISAAVFSSMLWPFGVVADAGVYQVRRQDFLPTQPPALSEELTHQNLVDGRKGGVYRVSRQDFTGNNAPFSQNNAPLFSSIYGYYYPPQRLPHPYQELGNAYQQPGNTYQQSGNAYQQPGNTYQQSGNAYQQPGNAYEQPGSAYQQPGYTYVPYLQASSVPSPAPPRLFVSAETPYHSAIQQPNYKDVLSLSEYNRRLGKLMPPSYQPSSVNPYWLVQSVSPPAALSSLVTAASSPPTTSVPYSPLPQATIGYLDDGVLPPIPSNDDENKPLPPVSIDEQASTAKTLVTTEGQDAAVPATRRPKYHSIDDFVEVSDEHRELLESFGPIENNDSDFSELPEGSAIRRRRNTKLSHDSQQLIDRNIFRLAQQIQNLLHLKKIFQDTDHHEEAPRERILALSMGNFLFNVALGTSGSDFDARIDIRSVVNRDICRKGLLGIAESFPVKEMYVQLPIGGDSTSSNSTNEWLCLKLTTSGQFSNSAKQQIIDEGTSDITRTITSPKSTISDQSVVSSTTVTGKKEPNETAAADTYTAYPSVWNSNEPRVMHINEQED